METVRGVYDEYAGLLSGVFSRLEAVSDAQNAQRESYDRQLADLRRQQQQWEQQRAVMEMELDAVRNWAMEMRDALAQQKREAELQQARWVEEIGHMRVALQQMASRMSDHADDRTPPRPGAARHARKP